MNGPVKAALTGVLLAGCAGGAGDSGSDATVDPNAPTLLFVAPLDGDSAPSGALDLTFEVTNFPLVDPGEHTPDVDGYIAVSYTSYGTQMSETTSATTDSINIGDGGDHVIDAELYTAEGETLDPRVKAQITVTVTSP